jgi:hypothetical protein
MTGNNRRDFGVIPSPAQDAPAGRQGSRRLLLADGSVTLRRVICNSVELSEDSVRTWVTVTRVGKFYDPRYGDFEITRAMLSQMKRNFDAGVVGTDIFLDVDHKPGDGAAARFLALEVDNSGRLRAQVEWTGFGRDAVRVRGFRYLSAEFDEQWQDNEHRQQHGCVLLGAGLTIRPVIKRLDPVTLSIESDSSSGPVFVHPGLVQSITESLENSMNKRLKKLLAQLEAKGIKLSDAQIKVLEAALTASTKHLAENDETGDEAIIGQFVTLAEQIAAAPAGAPIQLSVTPAASASGGDGGKANSDGAKALAELPNMVATAVTKALTDRATEEADAARKLSEVQGAFDTALNAATGLSDETRKALGEARSLIRTGWTAEQAKELATQQITVGEKIEASRKLAQMGFAPRAGTVGGRVDSSDTVLKLADDVRTQMLEAGAELKMPESAKMTRFQKRVLAEFDQANAQRLHSEAKLLAQGNVGMGDVALPASYQRAVILESLSDNKVLELVRTEVDSTATEIHQIPHEVRDTSQVVNDGVVFEGQEIPPAGVSTAYESAYITPMKCSMNVTNEVMFFSRNNAAIDYDAWGRTVVSNGRLMRELIARRVANLLQRESAAYGAVAEALVALTASGTVVGQYRVPNDKFPIVRPRKIYNVKGEQIGATQHPIALAQGAGPGDPGTPVNEYTGPGLPAGLYYRVLNYNLGLFQIVNEAGVPQGALADITAGYHRETNIALFNLDVPGGTTKERHLNGLIQAIGRRKAVMSQDRYEMPDFALMAATLNDEATNAEQFTLSGSRADSGITSLGDLAPIKGIPSWSTNAPNIDLGEERIQMGVRGSLSYTIAKPFSFGVPFEAVGPNGLPTGKKIAYGEEYSSIHVPNPYRARLTAVIAYSLTARNV